nr:PREDICTED: C-type mannose receptor 2-like [Stegastes partitus]
MNPKLILTFFFFGCGLTSCSRVILREYHYVNLAMNWTDAQHYCRVNYNDLATIERMGDITWLNGPRREDSAAWIGLTDDPKSWRGTMGNDANSWRWTATGKTSTTGYHNWDSPEPNNNGGKENCAFVTREGKWRDSKCALRRLCICYQATNPPGQKTYILSPTSMTWFDARAYCRTHYTDLAIIENDQENTQMLSVKSNITVWIGLYRVSWRWSDNSSSSFRNWMNGQPNNANNQYCAAETQDHVWNDAPCSKKMPFWCQDAPQKKTIVKMKIQTDADLSDPDVNTQMLDQIDRMMRDKGLTDFKLRWTIQPRKEEEDKDEDT